MSNLLVAQSGGPTAAINATLAGVVKQAVNEKDIKKIYGLVNGIEGIFANNFILLNDINTELLKKTPAAYLGSCRYKLPDYQKDSKVYEEIFSFLEKNNIKYFLYIGGNDSMDTVTKLSLYAREKNKNISFIGVPKTVDNDLSITDHTPGFGSAAKYVATTVNEIALDCYVYKSKSVTIVEIMGRHAGWLTAAAVLSRGKNQKAPHLIYLPEAAFSLEKFKDDINALFEKGISNVIVAISEGIKDKNGRFICETEDAKLDAFGHKSLSGSGKILENYIKNELGCKARAVELNVSQRCAGHILSKTDIDESVKIGREGVKHAIKGKTGEMMIFKRISDSPYKMKISSADLTKIANEEKTIPEKHIKNGNDVDKKLVAYLKPLIEGEVKQEYKNGIPLYLHR